MHLVTFDTEYKTLKEAKNYTDGVAVFAALIQVLKPLLFLLPLAEPVRQHSARCRLWSHKGDVQRFQNSYRPHERQNSQAQIQDWRGHH